MMDGATPREGTKVEATAACHQRMDGATVEEGTRAEDTKVEVSSSGGGGYNSVQSNDGWGNSGGGYSTGGYNTVQTLDQWGSSGGGHTSHAGSDDYDADNADYQNTYDHTGPQSQFNSLPLESPTNLLDLLQEWIPPAAAPVDVYHHEHAYQDPEFPGDNDLEFERRAPRLASHTSTSPAVIDQNALTSLLLSSLGLEVGR